MVTVFILQLIVIDFFNICLVLKYTCFGCVGLVSVCFSTDFETYAVIVCIVFITAQNRNCPKDLITDVNMITRIVV